jgi:hypothetical protein
VEIQRLIFILITAASFALLEIQIEGAGGWAENLPTWRVKNPFRGTVGWPTLVDGYHFWVWVFTISMFHAPFFFGFPFNLINELLIIESILIFFFTEDFFWFVFNPNWGIKKFFTKEIPWHPNKILFFPQNYWLFIAIIVVFEVFKNSVG